MLLVPKMWFNPENVGLAIPFLFLPHLDRQYIFIKENNKFYKFLINTDNHYRIDNYIIKNRKNWIECEEIEQSNCIVGCLNINIE